MSYSIKKIISKLVSIQENICVVLFGSYSDNTQTPNSDIDLLIITKDENIKTKIKNKLSIYNCDINYATPEELFEMWTSSKLNVGVEVLKNHKILMGYDYFIKLLYQSYNR